MRTVQEIEEKIERLWKNLPLAKVSAETVGAASYIRGGINELRWVLENKDGTRDKHYDSRPIISKPTPKQK